MKKVAILQSNYIPWIGYFDIINQVDDFVFYDDVQYTKNDWRNRNKIVLPQGEQWITIPVRVDNHKQRINETVIAQKNWSRKHVRTLTQGYRKAPFYDEATEFFVQAYELVDSYDLLTDINKTLIEYICKKLSVSCRLHDVKDFTISTDKSARLLELVQELGGDTYVSGPAAQSYLDTSIFDAAGIAVEWFSYPDYRVYQQLSGDFNPHVSIVDFMYNYGSDLHGYLALAYEK
jgi:hypothetical protein